MHFVILEKLNYKHLLTTRCPTRNRLYSVSQTA